MWERKSKTLPLLNKPQIEQAVILAAGLGSRLAKSDTEIKALKNVAGLSLIQRNITTLAQSGVREVIIVTGYRANELQSSLEEDCKNIPIKLTFAFNPFYRKSNGLSVLTAKSKVQGNFILMMADHVFQPEMIKAATRITPPEKGAVLMVDYKLSQIFDMDDATKVFVKDNKVCAISKELNSYNAVDTGLFICSPQLFHALQMAKTLSPIEDCSLSEGVATLMTTGQMLTHDIGDAVWQDVDDEFMLEQAERILYQGRSVRFKDKADNKRSTDNLAYAFGT